MRIEQLEYFTEIAKCSSISQASKNLFINQTTLSHSISALENELNNKLFIRQPQGCSLTPFGEKTLKYTTQILSIVDTMRNESNNNQLPTKLCIHCYDAGAISIIPHILSELQNNITNTNPANISILEATPQNVIKQLLSSNNNIALNGCSQLAFQNIKNFAESYNYTCEILYHDSFSAYVSPNHFLAKQQNINLNELINYSVTMLNIFQQPGINTYYSYFHQLNNIYAVDNYMLVKNLILKQNLIGIAPTLTYYDDNDLVAIKLNDSPYSVINFIIYPKDITLINNLEKHTLDIIRDFYKNLA